MKSSQMKRREKQEGRWEEMRGEINGEKKRHGGQIQLNKKRRREKDI